MSKPLGLYEVNDIMIEVIEDGGDVTFICAGDSMLPTIGNRRDKIILSKAPSEIKKNEIVLYKRTTGTYVLHRVVGKNENGYIMQGDNQYQAEQGIKREQIIAVLKAMIRKGKYIECTSKKYRIYCAIFPVIRIFRRIAASFTIRIKEKKLFFK